MCLWCHAAPFWVQLGSLPWSETADKCEIVISVQIQRSAFCYLIPSTGKQMFPFAGSVGSKCRRIGAGPCPVRAAC